METGNPYVAGLNGNKLVIALPGGVRLRAVRLAAALSDVVQTAGVRCHAGAYADEL